MRTSTTESARAASVAFLNSQIVVMLIDGREIRAPLAWFPRLASASTNALNNWRLIGRGEGIQWPELDEDISVRGLLNPR